MEKEIGEGFWFVELKQPRSPSSGRQEELNLQGDLIEQQAT
jgi:hypothetical protein